MKKIIGLSFLFVFVSFCSFAQSTDLVKLTNDKTENCTPTKECAEKMGMTLEECKKLCSKMCDKSKVASVSMESTDESSVADKKTCSKTCTKTKVASASAENNPSAKTVSLEEGVVNEGKKECSKKSKCCKKGTAKETEKKS